MGIHYETTTLDEIIAAHNTGKLVLPNFQREFVWKLEQQKKLLTSLLADIPIGATLLLRGKSEDFTARPFGQRRVANSSGECTFLLDGQQRLSCVHYFISDPLSEAPGWEQATRHTYPSLRYRWLIRVCPIEDDGQPDPFGYSNLHFRQIQEEPEALIDFVEPFRVKLSGRDRAVAHPGWIDAKLTQADGDKGDLRFQMAKGFSDQGLVPLWEVSSRPDDASSLHGMAIQLIAQARADRMKARSGTVTEAILEAARAVSPELAQLDRTPLYSDLADTINKMSQTWVKSTRDYFDDLGSRQIPQVILPREEINRAIPIFEVMNQGGTSLTTFDLIVARMARFDSSERSLAQQLVNFVSESEFAVSDSLWKDNSARRPEVWKARDFDFVVDDDALTTGFKNSFLQLLSVLSCLNDHTVMDLDPDRIKRSAILDLDSNEIDELWQDSVTAIVRAWAFLNLRCGIRSGSDLRNALILLPVAFATSQDQVWGVPRAIDRLEYWYWCTTLTGTYTERQSDNCMNDMKKLHSWLVGGEPNPFADREPGVLGTPRYSDEDTLLRKSDDSGISSDVGNYVAQYVLSRNPVDFLQDRRLASWDDTELELHHIIPLQSATSVGESARKLRTSGERAHVLGSPLNKTFVLKATNRALGSRPVQQYMTDVLESAALSHLLPSDASRFQKRSTEDDHEYYERVLRMRYDHLRQIISEELARLRH